MKRFAISIAMMKFPSGALALTSPFYVDRPPLESLCTQNLELPGSLTRIKAPRHMGKSSLLVRLLAHAQTLNYQTVLIDFQVAEAAIYSNLSRFLRWFCSEVARQLGLPPNLDDYWDDDTGAKLSATIYFEEYILEAIQTPIVLALNEVNCVFEQSEIAQDFLPLLRVWYEQAKHAGSAESGGFQQLRTIVVHSTDVYVPLNVHQSPFNVGLPVQLQPFNIEQAKALAIAYGCSLSDAEQQALRTLVGGHPYLLSIAFYSLATQTVALPQLLASAATATGIYTHHLQTLLSTLKSQPVLMAAFTHVLKSSTPIEILPVHAHQLSSLGLVAFEGNQCKPACLLYQQFFSQSGLLEAPYETSFQRLRDENTQLKKLANFDGLTQVANRRFFDEQLQIEWHKAAVQGTSIALIMIDIDYFKLYNDTYGHLAGDQCLSHVAQALSKHVRNLSDTVARYGGEEFAVILPQTDLYMANQSAQRMKQGIQMLNIQHVGSKLEEKIVTLSMGAACIVPQRHQSCSQLVAAADAALYRAKQQGRNQVALSNALTLSSHQEHSVVYQACR
ncbi:MAG: AAA-like domain-containing protein [Cyanobacteria bacterium J06632_3]